jgi:2-hydroxy-6-oxonona-2,4-dienedioate hydrolase
MSSARNTRSWRWLALSAGGAAITIVGALYLACSRDMESLRVRLVTESRTVKTNHGPIEFATWGSGPSVLVVHGAAGGYDQGRLIATTFGGPSFRWIAPSRFGYLGSPLPNDASPIAQADAFAEMLNALGVDRIAIIAMSGGVPPSLQFAQRHPDRVSALVLLSSAPFTPLTAKDQKLAIPVWVYHAVFSSDFPYWIIRKVAPRTLEAIFDVTPALRARLTPDEIHFLSEIIDAFQPVTKRIAGLRNEGAAINPKTRYNLQEVAAPALVIHAKDDGINPFAVGEFTADHLARAEFMPLDSGGHLLLGHHEEVRARVKSFLQLHAPTR